MPMPTYLKTVASDPEEVVFCNTEDGSETFRTQKFGVNNEILGEG